MSKATNKSYILHDCEVRPIDNTNVKHSIPVSQSIQHITTRRIFVFVFIAFATYGAALLAKDSAKIQFGHHSHEVLAFNCITVEYNNNTLQIIYTELATMINNKIVDNGSL